MNINLSNRNNLIFYCITSTLFLFSTILQINLPIHGDVSYLLYVTQQLLAGGTYGKDFFETNPPMILYLYSPVIFFSKITSLNLVASFRLCYFGISILSLGLCYFFLKKIISSPLVRNAVFFGIILTQLILPANQFGQREHIFLILFLPYLLATVCILENKPINFSLLVLISLIAGLGFCIKPYFAFIFMFICLYIILKNKKITSCFNLSSCIILFVMISYLVSTYLLFPGYFSVILPLVNQFYVFGIMEPWLSIITTPQFEFSIGVLITSFIFRRHLEKSALGDLLIFSLIGAILAFLVTRTSWFYHTLPALGIACILLSLLLGQLLHPFFSQKNKSHIFRFSCISIALLLFTPIFNMIGNQTILGRAPPELQTISSYIKNSPGKHSVNCFSLNTTAECFPLINETNSQYASRYPFFWWLRGLVFFPSNEGYHYLSGTVAEDLDENKPRWVIINYKVPQIVFGKDFDFISYFSRNKKFKYAWKHYHLAKKFTIYNLYERLD